MRLWHKDLIDVLPDNQLKGQWRECCLIAKALHDGNLNHLLVNKVKKYLLSEFAGYCLNVYLECERRGLVRNADRAMQYFDGICEPEFIGWHNDRYLLQCYYNLQEKYDCGGISEKEWKRVENRVSQLLGGDTQC